MKPLSPFAPGQSVRVRTGGGFAVNPFVGRVGTVESLDPEWPALQRVWVRFPEGAREGFRPEWLEALGPVDCDQLTIIRSMLERVPFPRFLLFAGSQYYPAGGVQDYRGAFGTLEEAEAAAGAGENWDWWQVTMIGADGLAVVKQWP